MEPAKKKAKDDANKQFNQRILLRKFNLIWLQNKVNHYKLFGNIRIVNGLLELSINRQ
jgi:hypothetical protein